MLAQITLPLLDDLFDVGVLARAVEIEDWTDRLFPEERAVVSRAIAHRRREFAAGRVLARELLSELGFDGAPLGSAADRTPKWPVGAVGSIAHAAGICVVAVARSDAWAAIGVDLEPDETLDEELVSVVCDDAELRSLDDLEPSLRLRYAKRIFCAKEATYKCWYPLTRTALEFHDVRTAFDLRRETFTSRVSAHVAPTYSGSRVFTGRVLARGGWILAGTSLRHRAGVPETAAH